MENQSKPKNAVKRKKPLTVKPGHTKSEPKSKTVKLTDPIKISNLAHKSKHTKKKSKEAKTNSLDIKEITSPTPPRSPSPVKLNRGTEEKKREETGEKYPILENKELINEFMKIPMNNNQKGRIRQALKTQLQSSNDHLFPDIINGKIQSIMKSSPLTDSDLRRIRILYNMLKTSLEKEKVSAEEVKKKTKNKEKIRKEKEGVKETDKEEKIKKEKENVPKMEGDKELNKVKGPKRYVVFLGNLPLDVTKDKIMNHFSELNEHIKDIRLQKPTDGKKSAFAYVELGNEPSYELALSKHHSMLANKRINVLYTTQKNSKISKAEAKSKSAKLIALQKSGKLIGSVPIAKKRSHRRMILKKARSKEEAMKT